MKQVLLESWATGEARKREKKVSHDELLDRYRMFLDLASKYKVAVAGAPKDTSFLSPLAAEYPDVPLLVQLVGMGPDATTHQIQTYCEVIQRSKNVYLEMGTAPAELIEVALSDPNVVRRRSFTVRIGGRVTTSIHNRGVLFTVSASQVTWILFQNGEPFDIKPIGGVGLCTK